MEFVPDPKVDYIDVSGTYRDEDGSISVMYQDGHTLTVHNSRRGVSTGQLSGNTLTFKILLLKLVGQFEDGVVTWNAGYVSRRTGPAPVDPTEETKKDKAWFPGKHIKEALERVDKVVQNKEAAKAYGQYERPANRLCALHNALKGKRTLCQREHDNTHVGIVRLSIIGGKFCTTCPYFLIEMDGNEARTASAKTSSPVWGEGRLPKADFIFPVYDPSSDLRLFLCDDQAMDNETALGRVIIPLKSLCTKGFLPKPLPEQRKQFRIMPATEQWGVNLQARYEEAVPNVAGSGMVRPEQDLGHVSLLLQLELTSACSQSLGMLAAYAQADPPGLVQSDDDDISPKVMLGNIVRFTRNLQKPHLLKQPQVYLLPLVLLVACRYAEVYHLPLLVFFMVVANGLLDNLHKEDRTKDMIFWEEAVRKEETTTINPLQALRSFQKGLAKFQHLVGACADGMSKQKNLWNFADPVVTLVALTCLGISMLPLSFMLYIIPTRVILFLIGVVALLPFFIPNRQRHDPDEDVEIANREESPTESTTPMLGRAQSRCWPMRMLNNVLSRVPDGKDIAHEHFCALQVLKTN